MNTHEMYSVSLVLKEVQMMAILWLGYTHFPSQKDNKKWLRQTQLSPSQGGHTTGIVTW